MIDDEMRGKTCQSVLEDDRVCGRPAVAKEFGCFFCAEHASASTEPDQELQTLDPAQAVKPVPKPAKPAPGEGAPPPKAEKVIPKKPVGTAQKTTPAITDTVAQDDEAPPPKTEKIPPTEKKITAPKPPAPPATVATGSNPSIPEIEEDDTEVEKAANQAKEQAQAIAAEKEAASPPPKASKVAPPPAAEKPVVEKAAAGPPLAEDDWPLDPVEAATPTPAPAPAAAAAAVTPPPMVAAPPTKPVEKAVEKPQVSKPVEKPPAPKPVEKPIAPVNRSIPEIVLPPLVSTDGNTFADFTKAVESLIPSASPIDELAKGLASTDLLAEIEQDLLEMTAKSFRIWEKIRSLQPDKMELELQRFQVKRFHIDLSSKQVRAENAPCKDLEDVLGGISRGFKLLEERPTDDPYAPTASLVMNLGILSGTHFMTGLRTFFHAYSPLKTSMTGKPSAMWSAGSGKFGTKLRFLGVDEIIFEGRCGGPTVLHITCPDPQGPPVFKFEDGSFLSGRRVNDKIQTLYRRYPDAHFAVIGPAGEAYKQVRYAAIALSTENQLKSGDPKPRFCGRGGIGGVMGSKNLLAIVADIPDPAMEKAPPELKPLNIEVARGKGSAKLRDKSKGGLGGTWANYEALNPVHAMPEMNFVPTGTDSSVPLYRDNVEAEGRFIVKDESCYRCGIACHKNVYNKGRDDKPGRFRAKLDFEPLNLLSSNIGIFDVDDACELVALVDEMGMDSISCGVTLSYAMEYNTRHKGNGKRIADGLEFGDFEGARRAIENIGLGRMEQLGQGVKRLSEQLGETDYAIHVKGVELPAYLPQTNPGYPWALAGGHMSMRTYLVYLFEKETSVDYWVEAILERGIQIIRDDILGVCKFAGLDNQSMCEAVHALSGLELTVPQLEKVIRRTFLRGYRLERRQGFTDADYVLPKMAHKKYEQIQLPYFNTPEFFDELKGRVMQTIDKMLVEEDLQEATA